jgi:hypothetical protein
MPGPSCEETLPSASTLVLIYRMLTEAERMKREAAASRPGVFTDPEYDERGAAVGVWVVARRASGQVIYRGFYSTSVWTSTQLEDVIAKLERLTLRADRQHLHLA